MGCIFNAGIQSAGVPQRRKEANPRLREELKGTLAPPTQSSDGSEGRGRKRKRIPFLRASCQLQKLQSHPLCAGPREEEPPLLPACSETGSQELSCGDVKYSCILATASRVVVTGKNSQQSHQGWPGGEPCLTGERCPSWLDTKKEG